MNTEISKVMPQLQRLVPNLAQPRFRLYSGEGDGFFAWIRKGKRDSHWDAICVEYDIEKESSPQIAAALAWLSSASGLDPAKIDTARKLPRDKWNFQENGDGWILSALNFVTTVSVRVDALSEK